MFGGLFVHIHEVTQPDYPFVWDPRQAFVRRMEMSTVWFSTETPTSAFFADS